MLKERAERRRVLVMMMVLYYFLQNMALIIALMYLALKTREHWFSNIVGSLNAPFVNGLFVGLLTLAIMYNPYIYDGMRIDLREAPIYFIAFVGGLPTGIIAAAIPTVFRFMIEGPTMLYGIIVSIWLPVLIGSLFFDKRDYTPPLSILNIKRMLIGFAVYEAIKIAITAWLGFAPILLTASMAVFAFIVVLALGLMLNDAHNHIIDRKTLEYESNHDVLTNLPNLRFFRRQVNPLVFQKVPLAIVMLDVDHFKKYNDTNGHPAGDEVLRELGFLMKENMRTSDYVARYGGEEFIFSFTEVSDKEQAWKLAERVRKQVELQTFKGEETQPGGKVTVSMGISLSGEDKTLDELIEEADRALYESKRQGRNRVTLFEKAAVQSGT